MAGSAASLNSWCSAIVLVFLVATLWSYLVNVIVPEPYLVSSIPESPNNAHFTRMKSFILDKHKPISAADGTSGTLS